jgi:hypothetical protein
MSTTESLKDVPVTLLRSDEAADKYRVSRGTMRWWLFQRERNGLNQAVVRIGRLIRIHEPRFVRWLEEHIESA